VIEIERQGMWNQETDQTLRPRTSDIEKPVQHALSISASRNPQQGGTLFQKCNSMCANIDNWLALISPSGDEHHNKTPTASSGVGCSCCTMLLLKYQDRLDQTWPLYLKARYEDWSLLDRSDNSSDYRYSAKLLNAKTMVVSTSGE
jgi:hypothetical protein